MYIVIVCMYVCMNNFISNNSWYVLHLSWRMNKVEDLKSNVNIQISWIIRYTSKWGHMKKIRLTKSSMAIRTVRTKARVTRHTRSLLFYFKMSSFLPSAGHMSIRNHEYNEIKPGQNKHQQNDIITISIVWKDSSRIITHKREISSWTAYLPHFGRGRPHTRWPTTSRLVFEADDVELPTRALLDCEQRRVGWRGRLRPSHPAPLHVTRAIMSLLRAKRPTATRASNSRRPRYLRLLWALEEESRPDSPGRRRSRLPLPLVPTAGAT